MRTLATVAVCWALLSVPLSLLVGHRLRTVRRQSTRAVQHDVDRLLAQSRARDTLRRMQEGRHG